MFKTQSRFWGWTLFGWLIVIALLVFGMAKCVNAAEVARGVDDRGGQTVLRLYPEPCTNEAVQRHLVAMQLAPYFIERFKRATLVYWGREWASCWLEYNGQVFSVDEEGAPFQPVPRSAFRDEAL